MTESNEESGTRRLTMRGAITRDRILRVAADLIRVQGVSATTLDEVLEVSGTSKSQLYRHFPDKESLVHAVIALRAREVLDNQCQQLEGLNSLLGLRRWRNSVVQSNALVHGAYGCVLGSLASELADQDEGARSDLAGHFEMWEELLASGLDRMRLNGGLRQDADPIQLATAIMAALQGGYLLAQLAKGTRPMEIALDMALTHVQDFAT